MPLNLKQDLFGRQPSPETGERGIRSYHPMTGNNNGNRIASDGPADSPDGPWQVYGPGHVGIGPKLPVVNGLEGFPDRLLKIRSRDLDRDGKLF
jgi:hypothetical protein